MDNDNSIKFCNLLAQMIKEANLSNIKFYTTLGIKKPYFYDILSGKVNPPPPERQFAMLKLLNPTEEQRNLFFDLAAQERNEVPADIAEILKDKELCSELRKNINYKKYLRMEIAKMSDNKREQERNELYRTIWTLANELRGSVDGWDFKQYVLGILFYRYISENLTSYINKGEWDAGNNEFDYAKIDDDVAESIRDEMVQEKGFFIKPTELFNNLLLKIRKEDKDVKEKSEKNGKEIEISDLDENLNEKLQEIFKNIEASAIGSPSEENFKGLFDDIDVNSNKLGPTVIKRNKRLKKLITVIGDMDLGNYQDNSIDAFGTEINEILETLIVRGQKSGEIRKEVVPVLTVYVLSTSIDSLLALAETKGKFICAQNGMTEEEFLDYGFRQIINSILEVRI